MREISLWNKWFWRDLNERKNEPKSAAEEVNENKIDHKVWNFATKYDEIS